MGVKYTVTAQNPDILKSSHFEALYAAYWQSWKDEIAVAAAKCQELSALIGGQQITGHVILAENVFQTTYENGVIVVTNYTSLPYDYEGYTVEGGTYYLTQEGGAL